MFSKTALNAVSASFFGSVILMGAPAIAGTTINDLSVSSCSTANCSSETITGSTTTHGVFSIPWVIQVGAEAGECMRLQTTSQDADLEIVAISPSGTVFRDDDGGGNLLSLVKIATTERGWYTVRVAQFAGAATAGNFTLRYGRYTAGNGNCASPTSPAAAVQSNVKAR